MLWFKALHIVLVVSWFAGLFYLPRIFVNLAMVPARGPERDRLILMARKLYRFVTPIGVLAIVALLVAYHVACGRILTGFERMTMRRSHVWFRWFNEIPVVLLLCAVVLVVVKPF